MERQLSVVVLMLVGSLLSGADAAKQQRKIKETEAKQFIKRGAQAEQAGHSAQARRLYLQAEARLFTKDAEKGLERLESQDRQRVRTLLISAERAWSKEDLAAADQSLAEAEQIQPGNATVLYDLALVRRRAGRLRESEALLTRCVGNTGNEAIRLRLVSLLSAWREPQPRLAGDLLNPVLAPSLVEAINRGILINQGRWLSSAERDEKVVRDPCSAVSVVGASVASESASLRVDRGLCAAMEGNFTQAADLLESASLANEEAEAQRVSAATLIRTLDKLPGPEGATVRGLYSQAFMQLANQKFEGALTAYEKAAMAMPSFSESNHQLALLADALGQTQKASLAWNALLNASEESMRAEAQAALQRETTAGQQYTTAIAAARQPLETLLHRHLIDGDLAHKHYALSQMEQCALHLQEAASIYPLAPEVNTIGALLAMQRNDFGRAEWHGRSLASAKAPLYFYAAVYTHKPGDKDRKKGLAIQFSRVSVVRDRINVTELALYNPRKHKVMPSIDPGQLLSSSASQASFSDAAKVRKLETRDEYVYMELLSDRNKAQKLWIEPLHLALEVPPQGPGARRFANQYTHLVASTMGYDTAKLGKESMTVGERMRLAYDFASLGLEAYAAVLNPMGAYDAYISLRRVTTTISQDSQAMKRAGGASELVTFGLPFQFLPQTVGERFVAELK